MKNSRKLILWGAILLVVLASAGGWLRGRTGINGDGTAPKENTAAPMARDSAETSLTHAQAAVIFANERMEFADGCAISPQSMSVKNETTVMFDNLSRNSIEFRLDNFVYTIPGYGFRLLRLKSTILPHAVEVECGLGRGKARITLE